MIFILGIFIAPLCIAYGGNRHLEIFIEARAKRSGIQRDVRREVWRDRPLFVANAVITLGAYIGLAGLVLHASLGDAQYAFYSIGIATAVWGFFKKLRASLILFERYTR